MDPTNELDEQNGTVRAPGTVALEDLHRASNQLILYPTPSSDPNDPLNWSKWRKALNFILICFFVLWTFVQLDIGFTAWGPLQEELGFSINTLNAAAAVNYAALGVGCLFFIPFVHKYGRRPLYIFSSVLQFASCVWQARTYTTGDIIGSNLVSGLGGAISETIVQITIADMFFVHQHATMNAWYLLFQSMGAFLGPVASGYVVVSEGWRWMWWWCVIFFGVNLLLVVFFFEESKYIPIEIGQRHPPTTQHEGIQTPIQDVKGGDVDFGRTHSEVDTESRPKSYRQRLALFTRSNASIKHHFYQPIILLFTFPAVAYTALTVGCTLSWFAILTSVQATYMIGPPYNFDAVGIGLMNVPPMIGAFFAFFVGGFLNDKSIIWLSKRNGGLYEPEMRLWLALPPALITPAGLLMFGLGLNYSVHWALLAVGFGLFGFGFVVVSEVSLSYLIDCYQDIIGDALVGVIFVRNIFSVVVLFALTPWIAGMGILNLHVLISVLCFVVLLLPLPLLKWGKTARIATAGRYARMARRQPTHRTI